MLSLVASVVFLSLGVYFSRDAHYWERKTGEIDKFNAGAQYQHITHTSPTANRHIIQYVSFNDVPSLSGPPPPSG